MASTAGGVCHQDIVQPVLVVGDSATRRRISPEDIVCRYVDMLNVKSRLLSITIFLGILSMTSITLVLQM